MGTSAESRSYERQDSVVFCKTNEEFGGLSNMAPGFPLRVNGIDILTSEALYQACRFPHLPDVQRLIIAQKSPMTAKMKSKPYRSQSREDWDLVRVRTMRWCLRVKLAWNWMKFRDLLLATSDRPIVEESRKDDFWGAKVHGAGVLVGANVLGRLVMELREELRGASCETLRRVEPPNVTEFLLNGEPIRVVEAPNAGASAADLFTRMAANSSEAQHAGDRAESTSPVEPTVGSTGIATGARADSEVAEGVSAKAYPRRIIEVDLPIKEISAHARYENSLRHGRISNLHLWWARRPTVACRAVTLAALWPDPVDPTCPARFRSEAAQAMKEFRDRRGGPPRDWSDPAELRGALLHFVSEFSTWANSTDAHFIAMAQRLVRVAHESLGGAVGTRPQVVDPFAGGGSIPLESLRVGADVFASDSNPVAVVLNKVVLEYVPRHGHRLAEEVRRWGAWVQKAAEEQLADFYPPDTDGSTPMAYLWARTIRCEGPGCGAEVPLIRSLWLAKKKSRLIGLRLLADVDRKRVAFDIVDLKNERIGGPIVRAGSATCPMPACSFTTPLKAVREQLKKREGGTRDARLLCVVTVHSGRGGREYRLPMDRDFKALERASRELAKRRAHHEGDLDLVPNEAISTNELRRISPPLYGMSTWGHLFSDRQALALSTIARLIREAHDRAQAELGPELADAVGTCLSLSLCRLADLSNSLTTWKQDAECPVHLIARQAIQFVWDFAESGVLSGVSGSWTSMYGRTAHVIDSVFYSSAGTATVDLAPAQRNPLPDDSVDAFITDPPYYDSVPYAHLSDFFYVWLRRSAPLSLLHFMKENAVDKQHEIVVDRPHRMSASRKDVLFYEKNLRLAFEEGRRLVPSNGIGVVVFASKTTASWEAILQALVDAGWVLTASWPIDTEMETRVAAQGQARLASSVHLVCRPRENPDGSLRTDDVGDWRVVLRELPVRIHEWMPRLAKEGVVGADAIFACLGPALEIFSRYSKVEKASGERVELREYLEQVWAAVAREALSMIFEDADATGLEEDARLTAMWLWTLSTNAAAARGDDAGDDDGEERAAKVKARPGFTLEFDAARKIAQGLGAHLEDLGRVVEIKGDQARLLSVAERTRHLFGKDQPQRTPARRAKKVKQLTLFAELEAAEKDAGWGDVGLPPLGETTLDRVHQAMVLFTAGRSEALKRFLVEEGIGRDARFWKLAQSLSALYPTGTDERRWVDGVLARKKGLGF